MFVIKSFRSRAVESGIIRIGFKVARQDVLCADFLRKFCTSTTITADPLDPCVGCVCGLMACVPSCPALQMLTWEAPSTANSANILAPYQGSPWANIDAMLDSAGFKPGDRVLDLGAGDARVLIRAMQRGASMVEGWELSRDVYNVGLQHISASFNGRYDGTDRVRYHLGDARESSPLDFDIVTLFLLPYGLSVLGPWLEELPMSDSNQISRWKVKRTLDAVGVLSGQESDNRYIGPRIVSQGWPLFALQTQRGPETSGVSESAPLQLYRKVLVDGSGAEIFVYRYSYL